MNKSIGILLGIFLIFGSLCIQASENYRCQTVKVLQLNVWQDATMVEGGFEAVVNEINIHKPDIVTFCEVRNYNGKEFTRRVCSELKSKGLDYYTFTCLDGGIISRYPIEESSMVDSTTINRAIVRIENHKIAVYAAHLDYTHYACYLPRGYDGITWKEREKVQSVNEVLQQNNASRRIFEIQCLIKQAENDRKKGCKVIIGGDFNEPSWLDWKEETKDLYDHNGLIIPWTTTKILEEHQYKDAYRVKYPSAVTHPGFTWVADNSSKEIGELAWAPKADERDRIDFIFFKGEKMKVIDAAVLGPISSIVRGKRVKESTQDKIIQPATIWPSDHKGVLVTLGL